MRTSLAPGMLDMLAWNLNRDVAEARLFEIGSVYELSDGERVEPKRACLGATAAAVRSSLPAGGALDVSKGEHAPLRKPSADSRATWRICWPRLRAMLVTTARRRVFSSRTVGAGARERRGGRAVRTDSSRSRGGAQAAAGCVPGGVRSGSSCTRTGCGR